MTDRFSFEFTIRSFKQSGRPRQEMAVIVDDTGLLRKYLLLKDAGYGFQHWDLAGNDLIIMTHGEDIVSIKIIDTHETDPEDAIFAMIRNVPIEEDQQI
jgi:hypothetical protein